MPMKCEGEAVGIEVFAKRELETVVEQLLGLLRLASESVYNPLLLRAHLFSQCYDFVECFYAMNDERFAD